MGQVNPETKVSVRDYYPQFPENISDLLDKASQHDLRVINGLEGLVDSKNAPFLDPWHRDAVWKIFRTRYPLEDREQLVVDTLSALDSIKSQAQEGEPFVYFRPSFPRGSIDAGILAPPEAALVQDQYPGISLRIRGKSAGMHKSGQEAFPCISLGNLTDETVPFYRDVSVTKETLHHLTEIANGAGYVAFGRDNIIRNLEGRTKEEAFYAALALRAAGVQESGIDLDEKVKERVGQAVITAIGTAAMGLTDVEAKREVPKHDLRLAAQVVDLSQTEAEARVSRALHDIARDSSSSALATARALTGKKIVGELVDAVYRAEPALQ